jgi:glucose-6-phosphate 1-dehydrogenase
MSDATSIVIFGASGDLTRRKLFPALHSLYKKNKVPGIINIIGYAQSPMSNEDFRERVQVQDDQQSCDNSEKHWWEHFSERIYYCRGKYNEKAGYHTLDRFLHTIEKNAANRIYYLATPPQLFTEIAGHLKAAGMMKEDTKWRRLVVEKPFGHDLESAMELNRMLHRDMDEHQIYRIDHYLGKETVQNVLVFRFANTVFEPIWNRNYIDHVQITVAETVDVGHRAGYYDTAGVLRDMFQNHMLEMLALVAMEPPASFDADAIRNEKAKLFSAIRPITPEQVGKETVRAQYNGYRRTDGVKPDSQTATYGALRLFIDNWRWKGVPFYLRSGKSLQKKTSEITIQFKEPPHVMFPLPEGVPILSNTISICVQPDEGIHLRFEAKVPDTAADMRTVNMDFRYAKSFGSCSIPDAYERLLLDALLGDASLFTRSDGIEMEWRFIDPIIKAWESEHAPPLQFYPKKSWGPKAADYLLAQDGRKWLQICGIPG